MSQELTTTHLLWDFPWEIEVLYGFLNSHFKIVQEEIEQNDEDFVSFLM